METNSLAAVHKTVNIYSRLSQLHEDGKKFSNLVLTNFQTIFVSYFVICLGIFSAFLVHHFVLAFKRSRYAKLTLFKSKVSASLVEADDPARQMQVAS